MNLHLRKPKAYSKNLFLYIKGKMLLLIIMAVIGLMAGGLYGFKAKRAYQHISDADKAHHQQYVDALQAKQDAIDIAKKNTEETKKQMEDYQDYIDNSIYMTLDASKYYVSTEQYAIKGTDLVENIYNSFATYINNGGLLEDVKEKYSSLKPSYWYEIVSVNPAGNIMEISVSHSDKEAANKILGAIDKYIKEYKSTVTAVQGSFKLVKLHTTQSVRSSVDVENNQNARRDTLRNYQNAFSGTQNSIADTQVAYDNYMKENEADYALPQNVTMKKLCIYAIAGLIGLPLIVIIMLTVLYLADDRIRGTEELATLGVPVLGVTNADATDGVVVETIEEICKKLAIDTIYLDSQCIGSVQGDFVMGLKEQLEKKEIRVIADQSVNEMIQAGNSILITETGITKIRKIKEVILATNKIGVDVMGAIVID